MSQTNHTHDINASKSANWTPAASTVICGRGGIPIHHEGNKRLKALVRHHLPRYSASKCKFQKSKIVSEIVETVRHASPDGGFVKFVDDQWVRVNDRHAREKVGQLFRDCLHTKYKSSTKAKAQNRRDRIHSDDGSFSSQPERASPCLSSRNGSAAQQNQVLSQRPLALSLVPNKPLPMAPPTIIHAEQYVEQSDTFSPCQTLRSPTTAYKSSFQLGDASKVKPYMATSMMPTLHEAAASEVTKLSSDLEPLPLEVALNPSRSFLQEVSDDNIDAICDWLFDEVL